MEGIDEHQRRTMAEVLTELDAVDQEDIQKVWIGRWSSVPGGNRRSIRGFG